MVNNSKTRAIVLRRTNYGEADRILKLLTSEGVLSVIARGVRRERSKLAGGIELFATSDITVHAGKGDLSILTSARLDNFYGHILEDYDRLQFGYEVINLVSRAADSINEPDWFDIVENVYTGLDDMQVSLQLVQVWFYLRYGAMMGHELNLDRDVSGTKLSRDTVYMYDVSEQGLRKSEQGDISADHIKFLRLVSTKPLMTIAQVGGVERILPDCWLLARSNAAL
jgi:DNA repair protein RecO